MGKIYNIVSLRSYLKTDEIDAVLLEKLVQLDALIAFARHESIRAECVISDQCQAGYVQFP
jgi:hypothetical protein